MTKKEWGCTYTWAKTTFAVILIFRLYLLNIDFTLDMVNQQTGFSGNAVYFYGVRIFILPVSDLNVWFSLIWENLLNIIYNMSAMYAFLQG